jgi:hypothetical protein
MPVIPEQYQNLLNKVVEINTINGMVYGKLILIQPFSFVITVNDIPLVIPGDIVNSIAEFLNKAQRFQVIVKKIKDNEPILPPEYIFYKEYVRQFTQNAIQIFRQVMGNA